MSNVAHDLLTMSTTQQVTHCPYDGHIHTAQFELYEFELPNVQQLNLKAVDGCVNQDSTRRSVNRYDSDSVVRRIIFNPNKIRLPGKSVIAPRWDDTHAIGQCKSLTNFDCCLKYWAQKVAIPEEMIHIVRLDFALDHHDPFNMHFEEQKKLFCAIVAGFAMKHNTEAKDQYLGTDIFSRRWKNIKAVAKQFSMEAYDRQILHPQSPVRLRLEIRYGENAKYRTKTRNSLSAVEILQLLEAELRSLSTRLIALENKYNHDLLKAYRGTTMKLSEFARKEADRILTRRQLKKLYLLINREATQNQAKKWADNQVDRHPAIYHVIDAKKYTTAIEDCLQAMKTYLKNEGVFARKFAIAESEDPYADGLLERFTW